MLLNKLFTILLFNLIVNFAPGQMPDYSNINYWAAHSNKRDYADSVSKGLKEKINNQKVANVFFVHPTTYTETGAYQKN